MIGIDFKLEGFEKDLIQYFKDTEKLADAVVVGVKDVVKKDVTDNIRLYRDVQGGKVAPLRPFTVALKKYKGRSNPKRPLYDSGLMLKSVFDEKTSTGFNIFIGGEADNYAYRVVYGLNESGKPQKPRNFFYVFDSSATNGRINKELKKFR